MHASAGESRTEVGLSCGGPVHQRRVGAPVKTPDGDCWKVAFSNLHSPLFTLHSPISTLHSVLAPQQAAPYFRSALPSQSFVIFAVTRTVELVRLDALKNQIKKNGAIWVLWPKGRQELKSSDVRKAAADAGLVDVKVAAFSDALSALKLVIPVANR